MNGYPFISFFAFPLLTIGSKILWYLGAATRVNALYLLNYIAAGVLFVTLQVCCRDVTLLVQGLPLRERALQMDLPLPVRVQQVPAPAALVGFPAWFAAVLLWPVSVHPYRAG